jgi:hypothetical protein
VAGGRLLPGSPVTVVPWGEWPFAVFVAGLDGGIYTTAGGYQQGFPGGWAALPERQVLPGSPVTVVSYGDWPFEVFVTGLDGVIYTTAGGMQQGFPGGWASVPGITAPPGSPVTVSLAPFAPGDLQLFVTGLDGVIYTTTGNPQRGFPGGWTPAVLRHRRARRLPARHRSPYRSFM